MRVLVEGLPATGRQSLVWELVNALQFRRIPAQHRAGALRPTWIDGALDGADPSSVWVPWARLASAAWDAVSAKPVDWIEVQQGYLGEAIAQSVAFGQTTSERLLRAMRPHAAHFDAVIVLHGPRRHLLERLRTEGSADPAAPNLLTDAARFHAADRALKDYGDAVGALRLNVTRLSPEQALEQAVAHVLATWATRTGWMIGVETIPAPVHDPRWPGHQPAWTLDEVGDR
ncbi:MAG: hypothetical protein H6739_13520 [Alphaproteobacteria bacterium]|nr:hypothetical protein [Alphaproteobacteria bacterium]